MFCTNCGTQLKDDAKFCINCGQAVKVRPVSQTVQAAAGAAAFAAAASQPEPAPQPAAWEPAPQPAPEPAAWEPAPQPAPEPAAWEPAPEPQPAPEPAAWEPEPQPAPQPAAWEAPAYTYQAAPAQADIPPVGQGYVPEKKAEEKPKKKGGAVKWILIGVGGALLLAGLIFALLLLFGKKYDINMNDYVKVEFDGYDTLGEAEAKFDTNAFREEYGEKLKWKKKAYEEYGDPVDFLLKVYAGSLDKTEKLKNGETVTYKWKLTEDFPEGIMNAVIQAEDLKVTVDGLKQAEAFDPFDQLKVEFRGVSGYASVQDITGQNAYDKYDVYVSLKDGSTWSNTHFKNGDKIEFQISQDPDLNYYLANDHGVIPTRTTYTYTVSGLEEVAFFDPFEDLKVSFNGFTGSGEITIENESALEACKELVFFKSDNYSLKNGDEVTVFIEFDDLSAEDWANRYGMIPSTTEKVYTVSGLEYYASTFEDIKEVKEEMTEFIIGKLEEEYKGREEYGFTLKECEYAGYYFLADDPEDDKENGNILYLLIRVYVVSDAGNELEAYAPCYFTDIIMDSEGKAEFDASTASSMYSHDNSLQIKSKKYTMTVYAYETLEDAKALIDSDSSRNEGLVLESTDLDVGQS